MMRRPALPFDDSWRPLRRLALNLFCRPVLRARVRGLQALRVRLLQALRLRDRKVLQWGHQRWPQSAWPAAGLLAGEALRTR
jgi:hypothetical protein